MARPPFDPFEFDMSAKTDKARRAKGRRGMSGAVETSQRTCEAPGCNEPGKYRAPKSPDVLDDFYWFCQAHVREYNLKWNFFETHTQEEMERQMSADKVWERPTKPLKKGEEQRAWSRLGVDDPMAVLGENATRNPGRNPSGAGRKLPAMERKALEILEGTVHMSKPDLRKKYKALIKELHPDMNGGNRTDEEQLQQVVWAWDQLKDSRNFTG
ncbi:MAG: J domain-containing protein [Litoreibacter sp.]|uniref:J domain-containing protein n=1 Tax=Litoreibacter sp. TaxID=1969459 RepID=UPI0032983BF4